jgi:hypothetical protein
MERGLGPFTTSPRLISLLFKRWLSVSSILHVLLRSNDCYICETCEATIGGGLERNTAAGSAPITFFTARQYITIQLHNRMKVIEG